MNAQEKSERFADIMAQMRELADEALRLTPQNLKARARAYWHGHIVGAISDDGPYISVRSNTMADVHDALYAEAGIGPTCEDCDEAIPAADLAQYRHDADDDEAVPRICSRCAEDGTSSFNLAEDGEL